METIPPSILLQAIPCTTVAGHNSLGTLNGFARCVGIRCPWRGRGTVWGGIGPFTADSCTCDAAKWAGVAGPEGGIFLISQLGQLEGYPGGGLRNGVVSTTWARSWKGVAIVGVDAPQFVDTVARVDEASRDKELADRLRMEAELALLHRPPPPPPPQMWPHQDTSWPFLAPHQAPRGPILLQFSCRRCISSLACVLEDVAIIEETDQGKEKGRGKQHQDTSKKQYLFEDALLQLFQDSIIVHTSSSQRCYLRSSLRSAEYVPFSKRLLLLDLWAGRELLLFASMEDRRYFSVVIRDGDQASHYILPEPIWEKILEGTTLQSWCIMARVSRFFYFLCKRQESRRLKETPFLVWGSFMSSTKLEVSWLVASEPDKPQEFPLSLSLSTWMSHSPIAIGVCTLPQVARGSIIIPFPSRSDDEPVVATLSRSEVLTTVTVATSRPIPAFRVTSLTVTDMRRVSKCVVESEECFCFFEGDLDKLYQWSAVFFANAPALRIISTPIDWSSVTTINHESKCVVPNCLAPGTRYSVFLCKTRVPMWQTLPRFLQGQTPPPEFYEILAPQGCLWILHADSEHIEVGYQLLRSLPSGSFIGVYFSSGISNIHFRDAFCWLPKGADRGQSTISTRYCPHNVELELRLHVSFDTIAARRSAPFFIDPILKRAKTNSE